MHHIRDSVNFAYLRVNSTKAKDAHFCFYGVKRCLRLVRKLEQTVEKVLLVELISMRRWNISPRHA